MVMQAKTTDPRLDHVRTERMQRSERGLDRQVVAGALLALTGIGMILAIITNEALYPAERHYTTFANSISDLSGTLPPNSYMVEPNRAIFIATMACGGVLVLVASCLLWPMIARRRVVVGLALMGAGLVGIAVFPGNVEMWHPLFAMLAFVAGSVTVVMSRKVLEAPTKYFATTLGVVALIATVLGQEAFESWGLQAAIGIGGTERWIAYPVLLWLVVFGTTLMTRPAEGESGRP